MKAGDRVRIVREWHEWHSDALSPERYQGALGTLIAIRRESYPDYPYRVRLDQVDANGVPIEIQFHEIELLTDEVLVTDLLRALSIEDRFEALRAIVELLRSKGIEVK